jgi:hypothetical protein
VSRFLSALDTRLVNEQKGLWALLHPLVYFSDTLGRTVTVPAGFVTDYASVPRLPLVYLAAGGKGDRAAVVHDWAYSTQMVDRATADAVLREALLACGYSPMLAGAFYAAVRAFGASHWNAPNQPQPAIVANVMPDAGG